MKNRIVHLLAVVLVGACFLLPVVADEIDDAMGLEESMETSTGAMQEPVATAAEPAREQVQPEVALPAGAGSDLRYLSHEELEMELMAARAEIERLKNIVRSILIANRREKEAMHYNIGCVLRAAGDYRKAEQAFLKALELNPRDPALHYNLGILYDEDLGVPDKARKHYQSFLDLAPEDKDAALVYQWLTALK